MKKPLIAGNWKMNKGPTETDAFLKELLSAVDESAQEHFAIFSPSLNLTVVAENLKSTKVSWGAQNVYFEANGAFTGETSAASIKELGANMSLVGHSERRQIFGETNELLAKKVAYLQSLSMTPMLCVGEVLEERESGKTNEVIGQQLMEGMSKADWNKAFVVAYEPVWAIGTGKVATPEQAEDAHAFLREQIQSKTSQDVAILYGGSVKPENAKGLIEKPNIDGFLIGGASLKVDSFVGIYEEVQ